MKFTFVRPSMIPSGFARDSIQPLVFAILSGLTPPDIDRVLYDQRLEAIQFDETTDLAVLTVDTFTAKSAYQIAARFHQKGVPVIMGGVHATLLPDEVLCYADSVVIGDAEGVWSDVVRDARQKKLKRIYEKRFPSLDGLCLDRSIFRGKRYLPIELVQLGRGCRHSCEFCSMNAVYGSNVRQRPVKDVMEEIKKTGQKRFIFTDDNLFANPSFCRELIHELKPLGVKWGCQVGLDVTAEPDVVKKMAESGCVAVLVGFESLYPANLKQMGKAWNSRYGDYLETTRVFRENGIMVYGSFLFGYDNDTLESFRQTTDFAIKAKLFTANMSMLMPFPATRLHERLRREGRLVNNPWWLHPDFRFGQSCFQPANMTAEELKEGCYKVRSEFNGFSSILLRAMDMKANFGSLGNAWIYFAVNLLTRREINRKRGRPLGGGSEIASIFNK